MSHADTGLDVDSGKLNSFNTRNECQNSEGGGKCTCLTTSERRLGCMARDKFTSIQRRDLNLIFTGVMVRSWSAGNGSSNSGSTR